MKDGIVCRYIVVRDRLVREMRRPGRKGWLSPLRRDGHLAFQVHRLRVAARGRRRDPRRAERGVADQQQCMYCLEYGSAERCIAVAAIRVG